MPLQWRVDVCTDYTGTILLNCLNEEAKEMLMMYIMKLRRASQQYEIKVLDPMDLTILIP